VAFTRFSWFALLVSSVLFGALHGSLWVAGIVAGLLWWPSGGAESAKRRASDDQCFAGGVCADVRRMASLVASGKCQ
jgi:hypothetical protein